MKYKPFDRFIGSGSEAVIVAVGTDKYVLMVRFHEEQDYNGEHVMPGDCGLLFVTENVIEGERWRYIDDERA